MHMLTLKNTGATVTLPAITTSAVRNDKGSLVPFKAFAPANFAELDKAKKKEIRAAYDKARSVYWSENKAMSAAIVASAGTIIRGVKVRTSKSGVHSFTITGGEPPKAKAGAVSKDAEIAKLRAQLAELEAKVKTVDIPASEA
jgi:ribosome-binding ATPase YchF (GTP1/OBG family)